MGSICAGSHASGGGGSSAVYDNMILTRSGKKPLTNNQWKLFNALFNMLFEPLPGVLAT